MKFSYIFGMILVFSAIIIINTSAIVAYILVAIALLANYKDVKQFFKEL